MKLLRATAVFSLLVLSASKSFAAPGERFPLTKTRILSGAQLAEMSSADRRYAINEIYARHGLLFGDMALRKQFLKFSWYRPVPGLTMAQAKSKFTRVERQNVERLGLAREIERGATKADDYSDASTEDQEGYISPYANTPRGYTGEHFPETRLEKLDPDDVSTMTGAQKRYAINEIYARHGFVFGNMALRKQFLGLKWYSPQPKLTWYSPQPKLTMKQIVARLSPLERKNLATLVAAS